MSGWTWSLHPAAWSPFVLCSPRRSKRYIYNSPGSVKSTPSTYSRGYRPEDTCIFKIELHTRVGSMNRRPWTIQHRIRISKWQITSLSVKVKDHKEWKKIRTWIIQYFSSRMIEQTIDLFKSMKVQSNVNGFAQAVLHLSSIFPLRLGWRMAIFQGDGPVWSSIW